MLHLTAAQLAPREGWAGDADAHLTEARDLAARTGEHNAYRFHFGPANVAAWSLAIAVELGRGPVGCCPARSVTGATFAALDSADRRAGFHLDLSHAYAQAGDEQDMAALEHIDAADRAAPTRIRSDPIARDLVLTLDRGARCRERELDSLRNRFGIGRVVHGGEQRATRHPSASSGLSDGSARCRWPVGAADARRGACRGDGVGPSPRRGGLPVSPLPPH